MLVTLAHNFADGNTPSSFAKTIENLISILESESETAINWFKYNHMIVNPSKFQAMIMDKHKGNHTSRTININQKEIKTKIKIKTSIRVQGKKGASKYLCNVKFELLLSIIELLYCSIIKQNGKPTGKSFTLLLEQL